MNDNVFTFGSVKGGKSEQDADEGIPVNNYVVTDTTGSEWLSTGFLIFTPQHLAIMREVHPGKGAVPVLVMPIGNVQVAELIDDEDEVEGDSPF
jgi:hypothetical protein